MSLSRALANVNERRGADPTQPWGDSTPPPPGLAGGRVAGVNVTEGSAIGLAAVYACVGILADAVATLPLRQYRGAKNDKTEIDLAPVLEQPHSEMTQLDWLTQGVVSIALRGNMWGQTISRDRLLYPTQIQLWHPDQVSARKGTGGQTEIRYGGKLVPPDDVFHIKGLQLPGSIVGINPIEALRVTLGLARAADLYGASYFQNSANPGGVISVPGQLDPDETEAMAQSWKSAHQGVDAAWLPAVLTEGATWTQIAIKPDDAQFIQSRQMSRAEVATIFRIPPHMMGDVDRTSSWGAGIEQQELGFVRITLLGWLRRFELALSDLLPAGEYVKFDLSERLRGDTLQRSQGYVLARNGGWLNVDEIRAKEDMPPLPDGAGEDYLKPLNMGILGQPDPMKPPSSGGEPQPPGGLDSPPK